MCSQQSNHVDFDLHGLVGIRLIDASPADVETISRQVGPLKRALTREPDISIRFVEKITDARPLSILGAYDAGFSDDSLYLLRSKQKTTAKVAIPFDSIGQACEIVCESGLRAVPLLIEIVNLTALANNSVPLHASGFVFQEKGYLCTGWAKGGKTETLLGFMANGAAYVGDEWVYVTENGMQGIPEPMHIWDWHLTDLPEFRHRIGRSNRWHLRTTRWLANTSSKVGSLAGKNGWLGRKFRQFDSLATKQRHVKMKPERLFGKEAFQSQATIDRILFVISHASDEYRVEPVDPMRVADRMIFSLLDERSELMEKFNMYRFAFPDRGNDFLEQSEALMRARLRSYLTDKSAFAVYHPYPVSPTRLFEAVTASLES